ncbi:MAG: NADH-quinone oxidoreductase subunit C [Acidimicrobiia bacterium]
MTTNPPDDAISAEGEEAVDEGAESVAGVTQSDTSSDSTVAEFAERIASLVGSDTWSADFGNAKVQVTPASWVESVDKVRSEAGLEFFSFLSAIDWSNEVEVGDPLESRVSERFEVLVRLSSVENNDAVTLSTDVSKEDPRLASLVDVFGGANWHEREAAEMFGIEFEGHPNLTKLYLPDAFEGFPLRKSFPLLSREVKPWPGLVDVEDQPSTENPEAGADQENAESEEGE